MIYIMFWRKGLAMRLMYEFEGDFLYIFCDFRLGVCLSVTLCPQSC